jgi:hypothetical protein
MCAKIYGISEGGISVAQGGLAWLTCGVTPRDLNMTPRVFRLVLQFTHSLDFWNYIMRVPSASHFLLAQTARGLILTTFALRSASMTMRLLCGQRSMCVLRLDSTYSTEQLSLNEHGTLACLKAPKERHAPRIHAGRARAPQPLAPQ